MGGAGRGGSAEATSQDQNTRQEREQGKGDDRKLHREEKIVGAQTEIAKQTRAVPPTTKRNKESSTCTAAFPAGVDPNRGSEETVRSPGETVRSPGVL